MDFIIWPQWDFWNTVGYSSFALLCLGFGFLEKYGIVRLNYSKFRKSTGISSRTGMFLLYFVPMMVYALFSGPQLMEASLIQWILFAAVVGHFGKRCLEVLFLHKYSGPIDVFTVVQIASAYSLATFLLAKLHAVTILQIDFLFLLGLGLFIFGEFFNFYHHRLLAKLRKGDQEKEYAIPTGGLFHYVTAPHYLMELCAWLGIVLMSRHLGAYMIFIWTCGYLLGRALRTHAWYQNHFAQYPKDRKALVPFLL
ncbi:methyltransferase [Oligoflexus tunisiensis]|uniref:methyltransferase n=1 Tax=Oligoflexus tunisiensis TaxID=708132 RepID=UPI00114CEE03|nr:DUF1295 domain-containing protein [Oligoflexus tunisiensis]